MQNFKIIQERENLLFNRKEVQISIEAEITPSHEDVKKLLSEKFSTQIENIKIKKISGKFGSKTFTIVANIYDSKEDKDKVEPKSKKQKKAKADQPLEEKQPETKEKPADKEETS